MISTVHCIVHTVLDCSQMLCGGWMQLVPEPHSSVGGAECKRTWWLWAKNGDGLCVRRCKRKVGKKKKKKKICPGEVDRKIIESLDHLTHRPTTSQSSTDKPPSPTRLGTDCGRNNKSLSNKREGSSGSLHCQRCRENRCCRFVTARDTITVPRCRGVLEL